MRVLSPPHSFEQFLLGTFEIFHAKLKCGAPAKSVEECTSGDNGSRGLKAGGTTLGGGCPAAWSSVDGRSRKVK